MVDAVVSFVVERLGELLIEQVVFLRGVRDEVTWLRNKLDMMSCFLKDAEEKQDGDHRVRKWISDVRDLAYDAEDIIDNFILKVEEGEGTPKKMGLKDCFQKYFCICSKRASLVEQANLYGIGKEINTLKKRLEEIQRNREIFNIRDINDGRQGSDRRNERLNELRREMPYEDNELVVGFQEDAAKLMSELVKEIKHRRVISIVGMGGLGKTTIARKLYNNDSLRQEFDCYAWVSVSKDYNIQDLLQKTIKSFKRPTSKEEFELLEKMKELDDLESHLRKYLEGRKYLVVVDDVWDVNAWASLRRAFPNNKNGSRVIMTTRSKIVAEHCDESSYVYELPFLKEEESWELFCKKTFPTYDEVGDNKNFRSPILEGLAREMVSKCRGLPLALVVLGGVLHRKHPDEWFKLKDQIWRHVTEESDNVKYILELSFNDLPHHLKSCFLYLGLFPEDYEIDADRLCWLWEAEGFIKLDEEPFEMAYLQQLIDRSLILVSERNWRRIVKCRVHDLLRDLAIRKSKELNFLHIYDGADHSLLTPNSRRLASHCGFRRFVSLDHSDMHLRTLLFFNCENESDEFEIAQLQPLCMKLRLLRVLDLEDLSFHLSRETGEKRLLDEIGKLIHLRYIGLRATEIFQISSYIGNLHALQTLELSHYYFANPVQLPDEIRYAKQLRRLLGDFKWPFPVDNLTKLRTLGRVVVGDQMEFDPTVLINLRELWVEFVGRDRRITLDSIGGLRNLQFLRLEVDLGDSGSFPALQPLSRSQNLIQMTLWFKGAWKVPAEVHQFPPNLKYLSIDADLTEDPFPVLEKLPNLTVLELKTYGGANKLACSAGGFPQLEILVVIGSSGGELEVEEGGMSMLKGLRMKKFHLSNISGRLTSIPEAPEITFFVRLY
ncbi:hypothetical protein C3L33_01933, partial [Rhododendron williamsianum]